MEHGGRGGDLLAAVQALRELRARVRRRLSDTADLYGVEVRCSPAGGWLMDDEGPAELRRDWETEQQRWKAIGVLALSDGDTAED